MKWVIIILGILAGGLLIGQLYITYTSAKIEHYEYEVLSEFDDIELRRYNPASFSTISMNNDSYDQTSRQGFKKLAGYIFGENESSSKIAMTSPVLMEMGDQVTMKFKIPSEKHVNDIPKPLDDDIEFLEAKAVTMAAISFTGWANDEKIQRYGEALKEKLQSAGISFSGDLIYAGYNPPFQLFNRRNEVLIEVNV